MSAVAPGALCSCGVCVRVRVHVCVCVSCNQATRRSGPQAFCPCRLHPEPSRTRLSYHPSIHSRSYHMIIHLFSRLCSPAGM